MLPSKLDSMGEFYSPKLDKMRGFYSPKLDSIHIEFYSPKLDSSSGFYETKLKVSVYTKIEIKSVDASLKVKITNLALHESGQVSNNTDNNTPIFILNITHNLKKILLDSF